MEKIQTLILAVAVVVIFVVVLLVWLTNRSSGGPVAVTSPAPDQKMDLPPQSQPEATSSATNWQPTASVSMQINLKKNYLAILDTSQGTISVALNAKQTPVTVNNFVSLARKHFYDNTIFHRVVKGFMIQGGDPRGDGTGGPGYQFNDEPFTGDYLKGTLAMANAGPNTNGSQFFIMQADNPSLPKNYVIFGKVVSGLEIVDKIADAVVGPNDFGENSKPLDPVIIKSLKITEK